MFTLSLPVNWIDGRLPTSSVRDSSGKPPAFQICCRLKLNGPGGRLATDGPTRAETFVGRKGHGQIFENNIIKSNG
jgi:hypothetical protein